MIDALCALRPCPIAAGSIRADHPIVALKDTANPTFNLTGAMAENTLVVGDTRWLIYTFRSLAPVDHTDIRLASQPAGGGPWTDYAGNPVLTLGSQAWENYPNGASLLFDPATGLFVLFYGSDNGAGIPGIGYATSQAVTGPYAKYAGNPVVSPGSPGQWDDLRANEPHVIKVGSRFVGVYMGDTGSGGLAEQVGMFSADSLTGPFVKLPGNPIIGFGPAGSAWEGGAADPSIYSDGFLYWIWFTGLQGAAPERKPWQICLASAPSYPGPYVVHSSSPMLMVGPPANDAATLWDNVAAWRGALYLDGSVLRSMYGGEPASGNNYDSKSGAVTIAAHL